MVAMAWWPFAVKNMFLMAVLGVAMAVEAAMLFLL